MPYATRTDMETRFNAQEIAQLEEGLDVDSVGQALQDASEEADSYVAVRYVLPLPNTPATLKIKVCDIARFRLYKDRPTEEVRQRYDDAVAWLVRVSKGTAVLTFAPTLDAQQAEAVDAPIYPTAAIVTTGVFSDAVMGGMPDFHRGGRYG